SHRIRPRLPGRHRDGPGAACRGTGSGDLMGEDFAQIRLAPLLRVEALYLLGDISIGVVIGAKEGMTTRRPGIHAVERGAVVILTLMTPELETALDDGHAITYA